MNGCRITITRRLVLLLKTRVSYSSADVPELADARFELVFAFVSSAASSILELVDGDLGDEESPNSIAEMRELTEAFLELAETFPFWETSASSSSDTESRLTLSGVSASTGVGVDAPNISDEIRELIEALADVAFGASSASSVIWVWSVASNSSSDSFSGAI